MSRQYCDRQVDRFAASTRGFTVIELLVVLGIVMSIAGVVARMVPPARVAFDRVPAELELQQRGRTAIDVLSEAMRSSGRDVVANAGLGQLSALLPAVSVTNPTSENVFGSMTVIAPAVDGAQGIVAVDQASPGAPIVLSSGPCPNVSDVCGFVPGATVVIVGEDGIHDWFTVAATLAGARSLTPDRPLSRAYPAASVIVEVDSSTFRLAPQANGSTSLIRETAAGAIQPVVDFIADLAFEVQGEEVPAGFFRPSLVDVTVRVQAQTESTRRLVSDRVFKTSVRLRNAS